MLAYCDYIAHVISMAFRNDKPENMIDSVGSIEWDLHPTEGWFVSTKKTISMVDKNGKRYRVTIEEE